MVPLVAGEAEQVAPVVHPFMDDVPDVSDVAPCSTPTV